MQYFVHRDGSNLGPFTVEELKQQLATGVTKPEDLAWHDGLPQWQPVSTLVPSTSAGPVSPLAAAVPSPAFTATSTAAATGSAVDVRQANFSHEENVRSIGTYYTFSGWLTVVVGGLCLLAGLLGLFDPAGHGDTSDQSITVTIEAVIFIGIGVFVLWTAGRVKSLDRVGYIIAIVLSVIGLLGFPVGTALSFWLLYLLLSDKSRLVFSDEYKAVIAATPQFQWKMALWVKIVIGLTLLAIVVAVGGITVLVALGQTVRQSFSQTH